MTDKMVQITVEILDILAIATKEMKKGRASEFDLRARCHKADIVSEKFLKKVMRAVRRKVGMKRLDKLTSEVAVMAIEQPLKVTHNIDNGRQRLFNESSASSLILIIYSINDRRCRKRAFVINSSSLTVQFLTDRRESITGKS